MNEREQKKRGDCDDVTISRLGTNTTRRVRKIYIDANYSWGGRSSVITSATGSQDVGQEAVRRTSGMSSLTRTTDPQWVSSHEMQHDACLWTRTKRLECPTHRLPARAPSVRVAIQHRSSDTVFSPADQHSQ